MIFTDKQTAQTFRQRASSDLADFITAIFKDGQRYPDASPEGIDQYISSQMSQELPASVALLLYRSGIIMPEDEDGVAPVVTFYDEDPDFVVTQAMSNMGGLKGGVKDSHINT